jgi:hypothetical protein
MPRLFCRDWYSIASEATSSYFCLLSFLSRLVIRTLYLYKEGRLLPGVFGVLPVCEETRVRRDGEILRRRVSGARKGSGSTLGTGARQFA